MLSKLASKYRQTPIGRFHDRYHKATWRYHQGYIQALKWLFSSRENTNHTYHITPLNIEHLAHAIAIVCDASYQQVRDYISELEQDTELEDFVAEVVTNSEHRSNSDLEARYGRRLGWYALVRLLKPKVVVETGVDKGLGSLVLTAALARNHAEGHKGWYYGTDLNPKAGYMLQGRYADHGEILYGDSIKSLKKLKKKVDIFINDSDHSADYETREYETILPMLSDNSLILGDNAHVTNRLADFSQQNGRKFLFYKEIPHKHWYPGGGIGFSYVSVKPAK